MATCSIPKDIWDHLGSNVNKSQYFNPIFSWFVVAYTYYAVGRNSGSIWKYLYYVTSFGLFANVVVIIKEYLYLKNFHINYVMYTVWFETYLYGINEWGFVYINFQKIRSCIPFLKRRFWLVFIYALLVYTLFCRTMIAYYKADEEYDKYIKCHLNIIEDTDITTKSTKFHAFLYIPIGVVELIFILSVMKEYFSEKSNTIKKELSALLHSTLFRTLISKYLQKKSLFLYQNNSFTIIIYIYIYIFFSLYITIIIIIIIILIIIFFFIFLFYISFCNIYSYCS